MADKK
ncbi:hypothetical protein YPPY59_1913, partial [Yersinia pestis PY-59]